MFRAAFCRWVSCIEYAGANIFLYFCLFPALDDPCPAFAYVTVSTYLPLNSQVNRIRDGAIAPGDLSVLTRVFQTFRGNGAVMEAWSRKLAALATNSASADARACLVPQTLAVTEVMETHASRSPLVENCLRFLSAMVKGDPKRPSWRHCWKAALCRVRSEVTKRGPRSCLTDIIVSLRNEHADLREDAVGITALCEVVQAAQGTPDDKHNMDNIRNGHIFPWLLRMVCGVCCFRSALAVPTFGG